ncbi:hypothetical protein [Streptococcus danieliae]|uniref:Uncharacterized protein n=1 Tax=Streptococcus danieliae TaxID=747656 RepID=A0A7Z0M7F8_9STRE|nr:hypothetical protein [Streptococcus danieliae]MBF0700108.1 hypothetical protein [Streptococcus danieliae]NYS97284.1 hypothetical protein [Streptococcus danieliae]
MEVMALPSKEELQFYHEVHPWVETSYPDEQTPRFRFKKSTPQPILELFESIKEKLGYDYAN